MNDSLVLNFGGERAAQTMMDILTQHGFAVVRSFDLRSALGAHADCECPYHGTAQCNCQFLVLLVYGDATARVVVTAHSRDERTHVRIVHEASTTPDPPLASQVLGALAEAVQSPDRASPMADSVSLNAQRKSVLMDNS